MKQNEKLTFGYVEVSDNMVAFDKIRTFAKQYNIKPKDIIKRIGCESVVRKVFWNNKNFTVPEQRRCAICHNVYETHGRQSQYCDNPYCERIYKKLKIEEGQLLAKFKSKIIWAMLEEEKERKEKRREKAKKRWAELSAEQRAAKLQIMKKGREKIKENGKWSEEKKERSRQKRIEKMQQKKMMKAALLAVLNGNDEKTGVNNLKVMSEAIVNRVKQTGDPKAATFIRDTIDEDPKRDIIDSSAKIIFAPPTELMNRLGADIQDAEYTEITEKEQYERLKAKFEPALLEDKTDEELTEEIKKL